MYRAKSSRAGTYRYQPVDDASPRIPHRRNPPVRATGVQAETGAQAEELDEAQA